MSEEIKKDMMEDPEDDGLKAVMGSRFQDQTNGEPEGPGKQPEKKCGKLIQKESREYLGTAADKPRPDFAVMGSWGGRKGFVKKLRECGKWSLIFGGLCLLVFWWQQTGQMMPSAAVPSMMACTFGAAWCVGRACK